ncbi:MAG: cytochrome C [Candidatus Latescibacteria bacterium]|jgi:nitrate/TMAO reductase-like tetraheme cytochrome c subunit|nr:cytochrome C [Candidatus Latescibacterota bacterium]
MKKTKKRYLLKIAVTVIIFVIGGSLYLHKDIGRKPYYVTSTECKSCHENHYESWRATLHPHMFKPIESPNDILGDFESSDPVLTFKKEEVEYVVGSKWEQVYVRMIDGEYYPLPAKWYIKKQSWVPYKVETWKETPMSKKCNGCHTTGFDPSTHEFSEFGIGCEACHGPGSLHIQNELETSSIFCIGCHDKEKNRNKDIITSVNSSVCGQCHNRGVNTLGNSVTEGEFNFPVNYIPGTRIEDSFIPLSAKDDPKQTYWWGNGLSKNRHQEYADWANSNHSQALRLLLENHSSHPEKGELSDACLECHSTDYKLAPEGSKPTVDSAKHGVTCIGCHEPHGFSELSTSSKKISAQCKDCHIDKKPGVKTKKEPPHYPCPSEQVTCADCHMPYIVKTGGFFSLRSHAFEIVPPVSTQQTKIPNSCQNETCHSDKSLEWAMAAFQKFYPEIKSNGE